MNNNVTDLILLIGTNPLPNYVAVKHFKKNNNLRIWMICSEKNKDIGQQGTKDYAENLQKVINDEDIICSEIKYIEDINNKEKIKQKADEILSELEKNNCKHAHLFYTGGSKAMAVHTYNTFSDNNKQIDFSFFYLSARDFKIHFDDSNAKTDDLRKNIKMNFEELNELHGFTMLSFNKHEKYENKEFKNTIDKFQRCIENDTISDFYNKNTGFDRDFFMKGCDKKFKKIFEYLSNNTSDLNKSLNDETAYQKILQKITNENQKINFEEKYNFAKELINTTPEGVVREIFDSFSENYKIYDNGIFNKKIDRHNYKKVIYYIDGFWFEDYVEKIISEMKHTNEIEYDQLLTNVKPKVRPDDNSDFEIDLTLMKGYQLIGISCTTSALKKECKFKGFEIILRTRQIGGTEAKAILITRADKDNVDILQKELELNTGTTQNNILVLGLDDWKSKELKEKLKNFIMEV